ncbi:MAG: hypothetical protein KF901_19430 [Myxococcales bacterium]|nr:hypothetical protein [Myxococcales bacterium]
MSRQTVDYDPVEELVEAGRRELALGHLERARWCFEEVLSRQPDHARALLGLSYVTRQSDPPPAGGAALLGSENAVIALVREKRYEEALELLERTRLERPSDEAVLKSIAHLEMHLERRRLRVLGGLDAVLRWRVGVKRDGAFAELCDGRRSVAEVLALTQLSRQEALRMLVALQKAGALERSDGGDFGAEETGIYDAVSAASTQPSSKVVVADQTPTKSGEQPLGGLPARAPRLEVPEARPSASSGSGLAWALAFVTVAIAVAAFWWITRGQ